MPCNPSKGEDPDIYHLFQGGLLAFPTETVWGLAGNSRDDVAINRLVKFKGRPNGQPISVLVPGLETLENLGVGIKGELRALLTAFWPGPLTLVVKVEAKFAVGICREDGAVGFRCSPHPIALKLAKDAELKGLGLLTATSCNRTGDPAARTRREARAVCAKASKDFKVRLVEGLTPDATGRQPSTVVDATFSGLKILREGAIKREDIFRAIERSYIS